MLTMNFLAQKLRKTTAASYLLCDHIDIFVGLKMHEMPPFNFMYIFF